VSTDQVLLRRGRYADSVSLMQVSQTVGRASGVEAALVAMATELNLELLAGQGFADPGTDSANDLVIAIRAVSAEALTAATQLAEELLDAPRGSATTGSAAEPAPRTTGQAARRYGPGLAVISVPGPHAFTEAMDAVEAGCDVLLFSDNVGLEQEIALKDAAGRAGVLVMGPDCGTAVVGGIGLGFAHTVDPGPIGIVAASGTGTQQVLCLLDHAGAGVRAALGVGGRDLSEAVGGRSARQALRLLDADPATTRIMLISKPPAAGVAAQLRALPLTTPVSYALLGPGQPDLTAATEQLLAEAGLDRPDWPAWPAPATEPRPGYLRGLFCGGTLCDEAMLIAAGQLEPVFSNIPLRPDRRLADPLTLQGHCFVDFGDDELTRGRPHPMIDPSLRDQQLALALADPETAVVLLDVVLGHGAHPDPAAGLVPLIAGAGAPVVISLIGARHDRQDFAATAQRLHEAGASVFLSNAQATRHALSLVAAR